MGKQTTRDAALSRLFGNTAADPVDEPAPEPEPKRLAMEEAAEERAETIEKPQRPARKRNAGRGGETAKPPSSPEEEPAPSGYIGLGRYSRTDGVVERITPYVRPDQAEALRVAVARKNDPRGRDVSQIIQSLLDEAGYRL